MSTQNKEVQNRFKFGGVEFRLTTDDTNNPTSLVSMQRLMALIQQIEPFMQLGLFDGVPTAGSFDNIATVKCVYDGLCKIAKDIDTLQLVTLPLAPNVFFGTRSSKLSGSTSSYLKYMYFVPNSSDNPNNTKGKFYYHTGSSSNLNVELTPQRGRTYYNAGAPSNAQGATEVLAKGWYLWNGSELIALPS